MKRQYIPFPLTATMQEQGIAGMSFFTFIAKNAIHHFSTDGWNTEGYAISIALSFTGIDPRKGWRTPLDKNRYSEQQDTETGYGYFGARYMDHELMTMWLSVDPLSDKYPSISPYAYCAWTRPTGGDEHRWIKYNIVNNPVKLVDPDGREFGDYYDTKGNYLGWDGNNDNQVYIVGNRSDVNRIKNNDKNGQTTSVSDLQSKPILKTSYGVLREACNVLERAEANSNQTKEECSIVDFDLGLSVRSQTGESQSADLPRVPDWMSTPVSIHSHNKYNDATQMSCHHADNSGDSDHFGDFVQNVIVGPIGLGGSSGLCFYRNKTVVEDPIHSMLKSTAEKIIGQQSIRTQREINKTIQSL